MSDQPGVQNAITTVTVTASRWFQEGIKAATENKEAHNCPYSANSPKAILWTSGWIFESGKVVPTTPVPAPHVKSAETYGDIEVEQ